MVDKTNEIELLAFEIFKKQLHLFIKHNYHSCDSFLDGLVNAKDAIALKRHFILYKADVYQHLGGDPNNGEDEIYKLERKIEDLEGELDRLEQETTITELIGTTLSDDYKFEHFVKYRGDYTEAELELLLKNGKNFLLNY